MKHFTINELCASSTAKRLKIDNTPTNNIEWICLDDCRKNHLK